MERILVVEDDEILNRGIVYALESQGYQVHSARSIADLKKSLFHSLDLAVMDVSLPDGDSRKFVKEFRRESSLPVIFLTARNTEKDMIEGFDAGGDDYMTKPFSVSVLQRRIQAVLKRCRNQGGKLYYSGDLVYNFESKILKKREKEIQLTPTERKLLEIFLHNRNQILTRELLLSKVWDVDENFVDEKTLNVNIRRMREKIEDNPKEPARIRTVFGIGYKWEDENGKA